MLFKAYLFIDTPSSLLCSLVQNNSCRSRPCSGAGTHERIGIIYKDPLEGILWPLVGRPGKRPHRA